MRELTGKQWKRLASNRVAFAWSANAKGGLYPALG